MAIDQKPTVPDSPQLAHYKFREKELVAKLERLNGQESVQGFDVAAAVDRTQAQLKEVRAAIKETK